MMEHFITFILAGIVGFAIIMYIILDGFDLGIGILFPFAKNEEQRDFMISSILPVWDGNETWLVLGGATLYGAFPVVYSTLLPTLYLPLFLMLIALIFRGVTFEFRHHSKGRSLSFWNISFAAGSTIAAFCQGVVVGSFVQGFTNTEGLIEVSGYHGLTPFSLLTGISVVVGYALLGASWLIRKTEGSLQQQMYQWAKKLLIALLALMLPVSLWTPFVDPSVLAKWFGIPSMFYLAPLPACVIIAAVLMWRKLKHQDHEDWPFYLAVCLFLCSYIGFGISTWPYIIPRSVTVWDAAAPLKAQLFILVGLVIVLPVIVAYTIYSYKVFRGKADPHGIHY